MIMKYKFDEMIGKKIISIDGKVGDSEIVFRSEDGNFFFYHDDACCEDVSIEDICGDLSDLINSPIIEAEEVSGNCYKTIPIPSKVPSTYITQMYECVLDDDKVNNLISCGLIKQEEVSNIFPIEGSPKPKNISVQDDHQWTFYRFGTAKGSVVIRWFGTSNGHYSTSVDFRSEDLSRQNVKIKTERKIIYGYYNSNGIFVVHKNDGPASIYNDGGYKGKIIEYYKDGSHYREDGPAIIYGDGRKFYSLGRYDGEIQKLLGITKINNTKMENGRILLEKFCFLADKKC
jgi:hypothetical protein